MKNKYEYISCSNRMTKKVYESYFQKEDYQVLAKGKNYVFVKQEHDSQMNQEKEEYVINSIVSILKRYVYPRFVYINLTDDFYWILNHVTDEDMKNHTLDGVVRWKIRQIALSALLPKEENEN